MVAYRYYPRHHTLYSICRLMTFYPIIKMDVYIYIYEIIYRQFLPTVPFKGLPALGLCCNSEYGFPCLSKNVQNKTIEILKRIPKADKQAGCIS